MSATHNRFSQHHVSLVILLPVLFVLRASVPTINSTLLKVSQSILTRSNPRVSQVFSLHTTLLSWTASSRRWNLNSVVFLICRFILRWQSHINIQCWVTVSSARMQLQSLAVILSYRLARMTSISLILFPLVYVRRCYSFFFSKHMFWMIVFAAPVMFGFRLHSLFTWLTHFSRGQLNLFPSLPTWLLRSPILIYFSQLVCFFKSFISLKNSFLSSFVHQSVAYTHTSYPGIVHGWTHGTHDHDYVVHPSYLEDSFSKWAVHCQSHSILFAVSPRVLQSETVCQVCCLISTPICPLQAADIDLSPVQSLGYLQTLPG